MGYSIYTGVTPKRTRVITEAHRAALQAGREKYQTAQKAAKSNAEYAEYWKEVKKIKAEAKKIGVRLTISDVYGEEQYKTKHAQKSKEYLVSRSLGIVTEETANYLFTQMVARDIFKREQDGRYSYQGRLYSEEQLIMMCRTPKQSFPADSPIWEEIKIYSKALPNDKHKQKKLAQEFFGS